MNGVWSMTMDISFNQTTKFARGLVIDLLTDAYSFDTHYEKCWKENWQDTDNFLFDNRQIADRYSFITVLNGEPIGFLVWDPRNIPAYAEIGHNCIRTKHKGNGYGKLQLQEAIRRICKTDAKKITVTTNESLISAQRNYESTGFQLVGKRKNLDDPQVAGDYLDYELLPKCGFVTNLFDM
jgi:ribosomal protein S18 acetylase RimI-like enzyme